MDNKFKVSLYIRVSTEKQVEGDSLEEQESELKKFCQYKNYLIHKTHIERGRSAKDTNRAEYQKLITDIKDKKINAVVVKKLDRLSRSLLDFEEFMKIAQEFNVEFISLKESFDTTNAIGKAMLRVALVFAQLEREQTAERITDVMHYRASQGLYNGGGIPFGYDVINREIFINKQEKKVIEFIYNKFLEIKSTSAVTREVNNLGYRTRKGAFWDVRKIDKILKRPVYAGKLQWGKKIYQGLHQPIITEDTFNKVQEIFDSNRYSRPGQKIKGILRGLLFCKSCNLPMAPNYARKKNNKMYYYYRCANRLNYSVKTNCPNNYIKMEETEKKVLNNILAYANENKLTEINKQIDIYNKKHLSVLSKIELDIDIASKKIQQIKTKKEKYLDSLISNNFTASERKLINEKIEEFSLAEKQTEALFYKHQNRLAETQNKIISINKFKEEIIYLKINIQNLKTKELEQWLNKNIKAIYYSLDEIDIKFRLLDF